MRLVRSCRLVCGETDVLSINLAFRPHTSMPAAYLSIQVETKPKCEDSADDAARHNAVDQIDLAGLAGKFEGDDDESANQYEATPKPFVHHVLECRVRKAHRAARAHRDTADRVGRRPPRPQSLDADTGGGGPASSYSESRTD